jgi:hypothetical protein
MVSGSHGRRLQTRARILTGGFDKCLSKPAAFLSGRPPDIHISFTGGGQDETTINHREGETQMNDRNQAKNRKLAMLGAVGLGLMVLGRKRRFRRFAMGQMMGPGGFGSYGPWGRFGGHGPWSGGPQQPIQLPPFIEATLKAWHDRAHGNVPPAEGTTTPPTAQV